MSLKPGQHVGQYVIIEQIGKGGMATVFRASQPSLSRQVAIKVLPEFFKEDPTFHDRFRQEAMAIAKLRHPNVLTVFDSGEADGIAYIVTELVEGGTLASKLGKALPMDDVLAIAGPVASALDYAHARGMIHRDVKPSNILIGHDGTPILSDFGLARLTGGAAEETVTRLTATGSTLGTPEYMAPEQVRNSAVGPAADIYALAVTLYEMLTGSVPYKADTPINVIMSRLNDPLPPPRSKNPNLSEAVQDVVLKGLAMDPNDRYRTAGEMVRALESAARTAVTMAAAPVTMAARFPDASTAPTETAIRVPTPAQMATPMSVDTKADTKADLKVGPTKTESGGSKALIFAAIGAIVIAGAAFLIWQQLSKQTPQHNETTLSATPPPANPPAPTATAPSGAVPTPASSAPATPNPPAAPAATPASTVATTPSVSKRVASDGLPPHGKLLYSLATNAAEIAAAPQQHPEDTITLKNGALEFTVGNESDFAQIPVAGLGDFVAVIRVAGVERRPTLITRFHSTPQNEGHVVRFPTFLHLEPPAAGAAGPGTHPCCEPFDVFLGPAKPSSTSLLQGPLPLSTVASPNEEQLYAISVKGPLIVTYVGGKEIARTTDSTFGPGGITLSVFAPKGQTPAALTLKSFDLYEPASALPASPDLPPHGKLLYELAGHLADLAQAPQQRQDNTIVVKDKSLELTVGTDGGVIAPLPIGGVHDFVAVIRLAALSHRPLFQLRFHRVGGAGADQVVQIPAYLRLGPPDAGARTVGEHPCCLDFDITSVPSQGAPTFFTGPVVRTVAMPPGESQQIVVSVKGTLVIVYAGGREIGRATTPDTTASGFGLMVLPRGRGLVPSTLRLDGLEIYDVVR